MLYQIVLLFLMLIAVGCTVEVTDVPILTETPALQPMSTVTPRSTPRPTPIPTRVPTSPRRSAAIPTRTGLVSVPKAVPTATPAPTPVPKKVVVLDRPDFYAYAVIKPSVRSERGNVNVREPKSTIH